MLNSMHEGDGASTKTLGKKVFFVVKMTGPAIVRPVSSDFWKAPCQRLSKENLAFVVVLVLACSKLRGSRVRRSEYPFLFLFSCPANFSRTFHFRVFPTILESGTGYPSLKI